MPSAPTTASNAQPAWHFRSQRPSSPRPTASDARRSACAGHRAVQPAPDLRTPSRRSSRSSMAVTEWALGAGTGAGGDEVEHLVLDPPDGAAADAQRLREPGLAHQRVDGRAGQGRQLGHVAQGEQPGKRRCDARTPVGEVSVRGHLQPPWDDGIARRWPRPRFGEQRTTNSVNQCNAALCTD